jgi:hypothetical protein
VSLIVHAYVAELTLAARSPHNDLAGFESWRHEVYGSPLAVELGLTLLPTLREQDIHAEGDELDLLEREALLLHEHAERLAAAIGMHIASPAGIRVASPAEVAESIRYRLGNVLEAVALAREASGGVYIG